MIVLLDGNEFDEARQQVNRQLIETPGAAQFFQRSAPPSTSPSITASRPPIPSWTSGRTTPAFLYAFANALAMRNVYISKAQFAIEEGKLHDRFYVRNRFGQKLSIRPTRNSCA